jgi:hypothetical protein
LGGVSIRKMPYPWFVSVPEGEGGCTFHAHRSALVISGLERNRVGWRLENNLMEVIPSSPIAGEEFCQPLALSTEIPALIGGVAVRSDVRNSSKDTKRW